jgi:hypothetical protein
MMVIEKLRSNEGLGGRLGSMGASGGAMQSFREDPLHELQMNATCATARRAVSSDLALRSSLPRVAKSHFSTCSTASAGTGWRAWLAVSADCSSTHTGIRP